MNYIKAFTLVITCVLYVSCEDAGPVVGSEDVNVISNVSFTITDKEVTSTELTATGRVRNDGTARISPPWYIEGIFYGDSTFTLQLGGRNTTMNVALNPGVATFWTLLFSNPDMTESDYPNFTVSDLRAFFKE